MKNMFFVVLMLLALSVLTGAQTKPAQTANDSWKQFVFEKENFKVSLPAKPLESTETIESEIGRVPIRTFTVSAQQLHFTVMVAEYPVVFDTPESAKEAITNGITVMTSKMQMGANEQKDIQFGKYSGKEMRAAFAGGLLTVRGLVVQNRMYLLMALEQNQTLKSPTPVALNRFFDSFEFVKAPESIPSTLPTISQMESPKAESDGPPESFYTQPISWREFTQPEYGFAVRLPGEPFKNKVQINPNDPRLDLHLWMARGEGGMIYQAAFQPLLAAPSDAASVKILLDSFRDGIASGAEAKVISEKQITFETNPGREIKMQSPAMRGVARIYLVGSRIYMLNILSALGDVSPKEANEYFASFKITAMPNLAPKVSGSVVQTSDWKEIAEPELGFALVMPDTPQKEIKNIRDLKITMLKSRGDGVMCLIAHLFVPGQPPSKSETSQFFKNLMGGMVSSMKGEIVSEKEISFEGHPGREYRIKTESVVGVSRVYLVNGHGYLLIALPSLELNNSTGISKFLDSFKLTKLANDAPPPPPPPPPMPVLAGKDGQPVPKKINVSGGVLQGSAIAKSSPPYPPEAKEQRVQGKVEVQVVISENGDVIDASVISGPELLRQSALDAARQWKFKPTELAGVPVKVQGVLTFNFTLQ